MVYLLPINRTAQSRNYHDSFARDYLPYRRTNRGIILSAGRLKVDNITTASLVKYLPYRRINRGIILSAEASLPIKYDTKMSGGHFKF